LIPQPDPVPAAVDEHAVSFPGKTRPFRMAGPVAGEVHVPVLCRKQGKKRISLFIIKIIQYGEKSNGNREIRI
jgi:hypothetical protein